MEFTWVDLQYQPKGADVWVSFQGHGTLHCYLLPSPQFSTFANGDAVDGYEFYVTPPLHAVQIPHEGPWHVAMNGAGEAQVTVSPPVPRAEDFRTILQPEKYQDPTPEAGKPHLTQLPLHSGVPPIVDRSSGPALPPANPADNPTRQLLASTPPPSGRGDWSKLLDPSVGMDQKRLDFLHENFFLDDVYPTSVSTNRNAVGNVITAHMSDGSTFEQWIADMTPMPGAAGSLLVLSPEQRISMARVKSSPLFGDAKLRPDGTIELEKPWYVDALDMADIASWLMLVLPGIDLAGAGAKALVASIKAAISKAIQSKLKNGVEGAVVKAAAADAAKASIASNATSKGVLTVIGKGFSDSEVAVANLLKEQGHSVVLRAADPAAGRMSDLLVDGMRWDVFTPVTSSVNALPRAIAKKAGQASTVIVDLRNTSITIEEAKAGNILARVRGLTSQISDVKFVKTVG